MHRHNLPLAWHTATDMSAIGWVMIAYSPNCLISPGWLASIAEEGDSIINATFYFYTWDKYNILVLIWLCPYTTMTEVHLLTAMSIKLSIELSTTCDSRTNLNYMVMSI